MRIRGIGVAKHIALMKEIGIILHCYWSKDLKGNLDPRGEDGVCRLHATHSCGPSGLDLCDT
jgi:hypothetical protein